MDKLKLHSKDLTAENIEKLAALFPNCLTETKAGDGSIKHAIDFDLLRQELSADLVEGPQERYRLDWPGKREALTTANAPIAKTLRPCREESLDFASTRNLYIEGDNLEALKLLQETYLNKVHMIYIDPPYNTGNDFVYDDDFKERSGEYFARSNQSDEDGNRLVANTESNGRFHSDWLSMIYARLRLARNLLAADGIIFVSIDDGEVANLRCAMDEVFGPGNFLSCIAWEKRYTRSNNARLFYSLKDNVMTYRKGDSLSILREPRSAEAQSLYTNPDNDPRGPWMSSSYVNPARKDQRPNLAYDIENPTNGSMVTHPTHAWKYGKPEHQRHVEESRLWWGQRGDAKYPRLKKFLEEMDDGVVPIDLWDYKSTGTTDEGGLELKELFGGAVFDNPKPTRLIRRMLGLVPRDDEDPVVVDFFSGSASTAHAVMQLNAEDGGNRRHIMVQLPELCDEKSAAHKAGYKTIAEIGKERIRRAGAKIRAELEAQLEGELPKTDKHEELTAKLANLDTGFRVLKVDTSNMADVYYRPDEVSQRNLALQVENIKPERTPEDLLFQVLLDWGVDLALPIEQETIAGKTVFFVDGNALAACFDPDLDENFVKEIAKRKTLRAVFRDASYATDATKINIEQIFKALSPRTELKAI